MAMFPIDWEETPSLDYLAPSCPYTLEEIEKYLLNCHYNFMKDEEVTNFEVSSGPLAQLADKDRKFWLFEAKDQTQKRQWFVLIGSGRSPFRVDEKMKRWMYAKTNEDGLSPDEFLDQEYREQLVADARS